MEREIIITSINAGGGHKTAMYSLGSTLDEFVKDIDYEYFISTIEDLERIHFVLNIYFPILYEIGYKLSETKVFSTLKNIFTYRQNKLFQKELERLIKEKDPKLIISTHFAHTENLLRLKRKGKLKAKIIAYVPDFDHTTVHFPVFGKYSSDGLIAQNKRLLDKVADRYSISDKYMQKAGYITRPEFTTARELSQLECKKKISKLFYPTASRVEQERFTIVVSGGAAWVSKIYNEIEILVKRSQIDWNRVQILVICGNNKIAYRKFSHLARENYDKVIVPFPFLPYEHMALLFRSSDLTVLSSIAPASLYELVEVKSGPIVIHRTNPGQEKDNLKYAIKSGLAKYIPDDNDLIRFIEKVSNKNNFPSKFELEYKNALDKERVIARDNAKDSANYIKKILQEK